MSNKKYKPFDIEKVVTIISLGSLFNIQSILTINPKKEKSDEYWFRYNFDSIGIFDNPKCPRDIVYELKEKVDELHVKRRSMKSNKEKMYLEEVKKYIKMKLNEMQIVKQTGSDLFAMLTPNIWQQLFENTMDYLKEKENTISEGYSQIVVNSEDITLKEFVIDFIENNLKGKDGFDCEKFVKYFQ